MQHGTTGGPYSNQSHGNGQYYGQPHSSHGHSHTNHYGQAPMDHSGGPPQMAQARTVNDQSNGPGGYPPRDQRPGPSNQVSFDIQVNLFI